VKILLQQHQVLLANDSCSTVSASHSMSCV